MAKETGDYDKGYDKEHKGSRSGTARADESVGLTKTELEKPQNAAYRVGKAEAEKENPGNEW